MGKGAVRTQISTHMDACTSCRVFNLLEYSTLPDSMVLFFHDFDLFMFIVLQMWNQHGISGTNSN